MIHAIGGGAAGIGVEIPTAQHTDGPSVTGRWMRAVGGNARGNDATMLAARELFVGIKHIQHARAITCVQRRRSIVGPINGFDRAIQKQCFHGADVNGGIGVVPQCTFGQCQGGFWQPIVGGGGQFPFARGLQLQLQVRLLVRLPGKSAKYHQSSHKTFAVQVRSTWQLQEILLPLHLLHESIHHP